MTAKELIKAIENALWDALRKPKEVYVEDVDPSLIKQLYDPDHGVMQWSTESYKPPVPKTRRCKLKRQE